MAGDEFLTDEEQAALTEPKVDEPGPTPVEPKVDTQEPSPPEPSKEEPPKDEPKPTEPTPAVQIDGIIAKDGKNFIPFAVLEQERAERQKLQSKLAEMEKARQEKPPSPPPQKEEPTPSVQSPEQAWAEYAKKVAQGLYTSQEDAEKGLTEFAVNVIRAAQSAAQNVAVPASDARTLEHLWNVEGSQIKTENPWMTPVHEQVVYSLVMQSLEKDPIRQGDIRALGQRTREITGQVKKDLRIDEKPVDVEALTKKIREEVTSDLMKKFNISKPKVQTLGDVQNLEPDITSKFAHIETLTGLDYDEAYGQLTEAEREVYLRR